MDWNKSCYYNVAQKTKFHREAQKCLKKLAELLNIEDYKLRSDKKTSDISGTITLQAEDLYIEVSQSVSPECGILIRAGKDFNHFVPLAWLDNLPRLAVKCEAIIKAEKETV